MSTSTPENKVAIVIDGTMPAGLAANTAAVLALSLGHELGRQILGEDVFDADGSRHRGITTVPIPILTADQQSVRDIRDRALDGEQSVTIVDFTDCAQRTRTYEDYAAQLQSTQANDLVYFGVAIHGPKKFVQKLTGSLPLLR